MPQTTYGKSAVVTKSTKNKCRLCEDEKKLNCVFCHLPLPQSDKKRQIAMHLECWKKADEDSNSPEKIDYGALNTGDDNCSTDICRMWEIDHWCFRRNGPVFPASSK
jgi:hypothetical protein